MNRVGIEFHDFDNMDLFHAIYGVASINGFDDVSWHNDAMPCMERVFQFETKPNVTVKIWIDWKNPNYSDFAEFRESGQWKQIAIVELNERDDLADYKWAQVLKMQIESIKSQHPMRDEIYNQAQTLFKKPLSKIAMVTE